MFNIKLTERTSAFLRIASILGVILLLTLQYFWIRNAYKTVEKNVIIDCQKALQSAFEEELELRNKNTVKLQFEEGEEPKDRTVLQTFELKYAEDVKILMSDLLIGSGAKIDLKFIDSTFNQKVYKLFGMQPEFRVSVVKDEKYEIGKSKLQLFKTNSSTKSLTVRFRIGAERSLKLSMDSPIYLILWQARSIFLTSIILIIIIGCILILQFQNFNREKKFSNMLVDYTRMLAHDLQSPISSIQMMLNQVRQGSELKKESDYVFQMGIDYTERMLHNINNLLYLSVSQKKKLIVNKTMVDAELLLAQICERVKRLSQNQKTVHYNIHSTPHRFFVSMDLVLMENVFYNIVENAVKYSNEIVNINITIIKTDKEYTFAFQDDGLGIEKNAIKKIFNMFNRGDKEDGMLLSGFGVGLNVVQKIVHAHNGSISVESQLGSGSTFTLHIPLA